jgi:hypothetical protein
MMQIRTQQPRIKSDDQQESKSVDQQKSSELVKLIRKLRWIGMEREADVVARALIERFASRNLSAGPSDAD